ncbi:MAG TPA: MarR family winged helix-turn-helix transcriptional regulator [Acidobacteriota bacterium]|nr:MarR family winged helix-turn-helix transcriptional regulator [Acidobacteriota bacterium]
MSEREIDTSSQATEEKLDFEQTAREIAMGCLAGRVRLLNRVITGAYNEALRPHGVRVEQLGLMSMVAFLDQPTPSDIERFLRLDRSTLSRNLRRLRENGWIETVPGPDARSHRLKVTPQGQALLRRALASWRGAQQKLRDELGEDVLQALFTVASRLTGDEDTPRQRQDADHNETP